MPLKNLKYLSYQPDLQQTKQVYKKEPDVRLLNLELHCQLKYV